MTSRRSFSVSRRPGPARYRGLSGVHTPPLAAAAFAVAFAAAAAAFSVGDGCAALTQNFLALCASNAYDGCIFTRSVCCCCCCCLLLFVCLSPCVSASVYVSLSSPLLFYHEHWCCRAQGHRAACISIRMRIEPRERGLSLLPPPKSLLDSRCLCAFPSVSSCVL